MGMRMHIRANGKSVGDDHKFYGYYPYEEVKNSFLVLYPLLKEQWDYIRDDCETVEDAYDYFKWVPYTGEVVVNEDVFKEFAKAYIADLVLSDKEPEVVGCVATYLAEMATKIPGDKCIEWC